MGYGKGLCIEQCKSIIVITLFMKRLYKASTDKQYNALDENKQMLK